MYKKKRIYYRMFSVLLSLVMIVLSVPISAVAQDEVERVTNVGNTSEQAYNASTFQKSPEVLAADAEAMRREQLIQNGIDPDQPLSNNSTAQLVQGGEELQPLVSYDQVLSGGDGVYAIKHLRGNYFIKTEHPEWLAGYHMQQQYTSSSTIMNNFSTGYLFKLTQHPDTGSYIIRLMYNNALSFDITSKADGSGYEVLTKDIQLDDALVPLSDTYVISASGSGFKIRKYGTTNCIAVNGSQTNLTATTEIGDSIRWTFTQYTGAERNSAVMLYSSLPTVGQTTTLIPVIYSTRPGYNMPYLDMSQIPSESYHISGPNEYGRFSLTPHDGPDWTFHIYVKNASSPSLTPVYASAQDFKIKLPIDEGTYFFNNVEYDDKFMQIDNNASPSTNGAIMELWDFDGEDDQKWELDHLADGYYKITSVASGKALTMTTETDGSVTQTDYTENFNQLWLISENSNGTYSLRSYVFYLAAGDGIFTSNGRNVEGRTAQSDGKDEWKLNPYAVTLYGITNVNHDHISSLREIQDELSSKKYNDITVRDGSISVNLCKNELKETNIFSIRSHGLQVVSPYNTVLATGILLNDELDSSGYVNNYSAVLYSNYIGSINSYSSTLSSADDFSNIDIALFVACNTGAGDVGALNLPSVVVENGARVAIGFLEEIACDQANIWIETFYEKMLEGKTVGEACSKANIASGIDCLVVCGDNSVRLPRT